MPAEWEPQSAVLLSFPRRNGDWGGLLAEVCDQHLELVLTIAAYVPVRLVVADPRTFKDAIDRNPRKLDLQSIQGQDFSPAGQLGWLPAPDYHPITLFFGEADDVWARDFGPISVVENGHYQLLDFTFNGWGNKFSADRDNTLNRRMWSAGVWEDRPLRSFDFVLEGGSIESDGQGTILTTSQCLLSPERNPSFNRAAITRFLSDHLGAERVLYLDHGHLEGDDTDAHIDTLARFSDERTIVYQSCDDPQDSHYPALQRMAEQLSQFRRTDGSAYRLLPLPWHPAIYSREDGRRLPATYANFLVTNGAVILPVTGQPTDTRAMEVLQNAFPTRDVIPVSADAFLEQHGSIHCLTMQLPVATPSKDYS